MYDSNVGRFINKDPIGFDGRDANQYRYVGNGVTYATDPTGLLVQWWIELENGERYSGGDGESLLGTLRQIDHDDQKISKMILKGHGSVDGISETMLGAPVIHVVTDDTSGFINVIGQDVTAILRRTMGKDTNIYLRACTTAGAAEKLSRLLPDVTAEGCYTPSFSIPGTDDAYMPALALETYKNGRLIPNVPEKGAGGASVEAMKRSKRWEKTRVKLHAQDD